MLGEEGKPRPDPTGQVSTSGPHCWCRKMCPRVAGARLSGLVASAANGELRVPDTSGTGTGLGR